MKKILICVFGMFLVACGGTETPPTQPNGMDIQSTTVETKGLGEMCGGIAAIRCQSGLSCKLDGQHPDAGGVCVETVVDKNLECSKEKAPVCAIKDRNKNGYLNECEARRHGAEILHDWFCENDPSVKNNCKAQVIGIGNCEGFIIGYEFDGKKCQEYGVSGCEAEIPFDTLEDCQNVCE